MRFPRNPKMTMETEAASDRRRHGRLRCESTRSCIGDVVDISASGMRVQRSGRPVLEVGDEFRITVHPDAGEPVLTLPSRVVWIERKGFRKHIYGIEFAELSDDQKRRLSELARIVCDQIVFRCAS
ncbi:MAG: PilZ domain-containing protein [Phycisphaerales bacterium]